MKKYLLLFVIAVFAMSCSKKVEVKGKIAGSSPLERIEFVEASGVGTLPLTNIGLDKGGNFSGTFEAPKDGMYAINYAGKQNLIFLKGGQSLNISGNAATFPNEFVLTGDAKNDNDFIKACQKYMESYGSTINIQQLYGGSESTFLKGAQKIHADLNKNAEENIKKINPGNEVVKWQKQFVNTIVLNIMTGYEMSKKQMGNTSFKTSKTFTDYETSLQEDKEEMVRTSPFYREYLKNKLLPDFQKFAQDKSKANPEITASELFTDFLKTKKEISQTAKDYLLAFMMAQYDMHLDTPEKNRAKIESIIEKDIKDESVKQDLKKLQFAMLGVKKGDPVPDAALEKQDGSSFSLTQNANKPTMLIFYASWNPYIAENTLPVLKEVVSFYKSKMNFVFVNMDDNKEQFSKTSMAMFKGVSGTSVYAKGGLNSDAAKKFGIYGFKLPCFVVVDRNGKIAGRPYMNLGEQELITILDKQTGLSAPMVNPSQMQPQVMSPAQMEQNGPPPPPQTKK